MDLVTILPTHFIPYVEKDIKQSFVKNIITTKRLNLEEHLYPAQEGRQQGGQQYLGLKVRLKTIPGKAGQPGPDLDLDLVRKILQ